MKKKALGILMALCAALSLAPVTALAAGGSAPTAVKSVGLGTSMLPNPEVPKDVDAAWKGSYVYYGIYKGQPIKFRMLSKNTTDFGGGRHCWHGGDDHPVQYRVRNVYAEAV